MRGWVTIPGEKLKRQTASFSAKRKRLQLEDKIGPEKVGMPSRYNLLDDVTAFRIRFGRDERADGEAAQSIADGKGRFCGIFSTRERQRIRPALALSIQVDPADLVCQGINEF